MRKHRLAFCVCVDGVLDSSTAYPTEGEAGQAAQQRFDQGGANCVWVEVDWFRVLSDLSDAGVSNAKVAFLLNLPASTVEKTKAGSVPHHPYGEQLLALHRKYAAA